MSVPPYNSANYPVTFSPRNHSWIDHQMHWLAFFLCKCAIHGSGTRFYNKAKSLQWSQPEHGNFWKLSTLTLEYKLLKGNITRHSGRGIILTYSHNQVGHVFISYNSESWLHSSCPICQPQPLQRQPCQSHLLSGLPLPHYLWPRLPFTVRSTGNYWICHCSEVKLILINIQTVTCLINANPHYFIAFATLNELTVCPLNNMPLCKTTAE